MTRSTLHFFSILLLIALGLCPAILADSDSSSGSSNDSSGFGDNSTEAEPEAKSGAAPATSPSPPTVQDIIYERVMVTGDPEHLDRLPGSAHVVTKEELEQHGHTDLHRILRQVPGINIQEEDGFGLRPNIGIRGTGVERSSKITLMEDGVLIAPAPYSAPSAYYTPSAGRMETIEVRKGSAAIEQGPFTIGGAVNLVSSSIPAERGGRLSLSAGDHGTRKLHATYGTSGERWGFLVETLQQQSDGFKHIDGGGDSGFELSDYMLKLRFGSRSGARIQQSLELKLGRTDQDGDETYLGLTRDDFEADPYRRYAASRNDRILAQHEQIQLRHFLYLPSGLDITTTIYRNDFFRNWYKNEAVLGTSNRSILDNPEGHALELAILRGEVDSVADAIALRNNRRDYFAQGIQTVIGKSFERGNVRHDMEWSVRYHEDEEDRFQEDDRYAIRDGELFLTSLGAPGSNANRIGSAEAVALYLQDRISFGEKWTLTPGLRYETIDFQRLDYGKQDPLRTGDALKVRSNRVDELIPGVGIEYRLRDGWNVFAGVHRGFAPPGPSSTEEVEPETSVNYELGTRWRGGNLSWETIVFHNDYDNLLGADTLSTGGGGTGDFFNGGEVTVQGLEAALGVDLYRGGGFTVPLSMTYTYTHGEFDTSFETSFADWAPRVEQGDEIPYLPEHQGSLEIGLEADRWDVSLAANFNGEMRTKAGQGAAPANERIDDHWVFDGAASFKILGRYKLSLQVRNLFDEEYVAARRPYGLRPGLPRTALVGFSFDF